MCTSYGQRSLTLCTEWLTFNPRIMEECIIAILLLCRFDDEVNGEAILYAVLSE